MDNRVTVFREIHKNTWLKRLTIDNKKITVGTKKSDRTWVVFCVHDDTEAILEGYIEPRQAAFHIPEWTVPLQTTLHISHALVPSESEYEFVITLAADVIRFNAASWEIMQEWVETLRQKLREMKILSPKENLYSKLPEIRAPLLPTRDPTSPLPAPPPVPAAIVPGIEQLPTPAITNGQPASQSTTATVSANVSRTVTPVTTVAATPTVVTSTTHLPSTSTTSNAPILPPPAAMSNTLTQNLINMLQSPLAYSSQATSINEAASDSSGTSIADDDSLFFAADESLASSMAATTSQAANLDLSTVCTEIGSAAKMKREPQPRDNMSLAKTFSNNVLADPNTCPSTSSGITSRDIHRPTHEPDTDIETSSIESMQSVQSYQPEPIVIPRPQTTRSSARSKRVPITTSLQPPQLVTTPITTDDSSSTNITIIQVSSPLTLSSNPSKDIFNFPSVHTSLAVVEKADSNYKSNVQIIPSSYSPPPSSAVVATQFLAKKLFAPLTTNDNSKAVTTVQVAGAPSKSLATGYGKIIPQSSVASAPVTNNTQSSTITTTVKNFAGPITNIPIGAESPTVTPSTPQQLHYEQVFVTPSTSTSIISSTAEIHGANNTDGRTPANIVGGSTNKASVIDKSKVPTTSSPAGHTTEVHVNRINLQNTRNKENNSTPDLRSINSLQSVPSSSTATASAIGSNSIQVRNVNNSNSINTSSSTNNNVNSSSSNSSSSSNAISSSKKNVITGGKRDNLPSPLPAIRKFLTRGLTEAAIIRPSRKDSATTVVPLRRDGRCKVTNTETPAVVSETQQEVQEQRRRSSSTSDAQGVRSRTNAHNITSPPMNESRRMQPPPQPFRLENTSAHHASGRLTLREQQVFQLRREMMHPGGVRLQLRRKDCTGSIALVDAFGAVWISGWKQKEHPMLYNALHIGDQLVSLAGVNVSSATDANRIIRNSPGLYIELIIRRIPFGRVYAIRRDLDGQCIGLIRDGNTATIVDVVPNSLSARHGLPPKAQTCDGLSLTFWVLTEINGRPLNLFFKDNEVRDRLNAVGRDISILVQPSDLIVKLKKQLKSLRGYKDYIVQ